MAKSFTTYIPPVSVSDHTLDAGSYIRTIRAEDPANHTQDFKVMYKGRVITVGEAITNLELKLAMVDEFIEHLANIHPEIMEEFSHLLHVRAKLGAE